MALSPNINTREFDKFDLNSQGDTAVRTLTELIGGGTVNANIQAPTGPFEITPYTVTDTAADPLPTPLTSRVSVSIRNESSSETVWFGKDNTVTTSGATRGWKIGPNEDFNIDLTEDNGFFLITSTGLTADILILEIASQ